MFFFTGSHREVHGARHDARVAWAAVADTCAGLQECPACHTRFVCPVGWWPIGAGEEVQILLRCGQCEAWRRVIVSMAVAQGLDRAHAAVRAKMEATRRRLERERLRRGGSR
jgi:flavoprotein